MKPAILLAMLLLVSPQWTAWAQPPGRCAHPRLGQARADRPGARAQRQHHAQPRRRPLAVAGPARRLASGRA